jgi:hypothetical protein
MIEVRKTIFHNHHLKRQKSKTHFLILLAQTDVFLSNQKVKANKILISRLVGSTDRQVFLLLFFLESQLPV